MTERGRNVIVGIFTLLGFVVLAFLILQFQAGVRYVRGSQDYYIRITASQTAAVIPGQDVHLNGKRIGEIRSVELAKDPRQGVVIIAAINQQYDIPEDVENVWIYRGQLGPPFIDIRVSREHSQRMMDKTPGKVTGVLEAKIPGGGLGELSELLKAIKPDKIGELVENLNRVLSGPETGGADGQGEDGRKQIHLQGLLQQFSHTLKNLDALVGDEQNIENFKESLANLRQASQEASEVLAEVKAFAGQGKQATTELQTQIRDVAQAVITNSEEISRLLAQLNKAAEQINAGQGTAGKILYDPALYEEMLSTTKSLNETLDSLGVLLRKWHKQGMDLKW